MRLFVTAGTSWTLHGSVRLRASVHRWHGHATEAARALIDAFFAYGDGSEITASVRVINPASRRVLEKCGFAYQGSGLVELPARVYSMLAALLVMVAALLVLTFLR